MANAIINFKTDPAVKRQVQVFAAELGVPVSVILNAQIKQMLRDRKIVLTTELEPTPYLEKILHQVEKDLKTGKNISPKFNNVEDMFAHLEKNA